MKTNPSTKVFIVLDYVGFRIIAVCKDHKIAEDFLKKHKEQHRKGEFALIKEMEVI